MRDIDRRERERKREKERERERKREKEREKESVMEKVGRRREGWEQETLKLLQPIRQRTLGDQLDPAGCRNKQNS